MPGREPQPDQGGVMESDVARTMQARDAALRQRDARYTGKVDIGDQRSAADSAFGRLGKDNFNQSQYDQVSDETLEQMSEKDRADLAVHYMVGEAQAMLKIAVNKRAQGDEEQEETVQEGDYDEALTELGRVLDLGEKQHGFWVNAGQPDLRKIPDGITDSKKREAYAAGLEAVRGFRSMMINYELSLNALSLDQTLEDYPELGGMYATMMIRFGVPETMDQARVAELTAKCTTAAEVYRESLRPKPVAPIEVDKTPENMAFESVFNDLKAVTGEITPEIVQRDKRMEFFVDPSGRINYARADQIKDPRDRQYAIDEVTKLYTGFVKDKLVRMRGLEPARLDTLMTELEVAKTSELWNIWMAKTGNANEQVKEGLHVLEAFHDKEYQQILAERRAAEERRRQESAGRRRF